MKRLFLTAACAAFLATGAQAHIGWDLQTCLARYGRESLADKPTNAGDVYFFDAGGMHITVTLRNDKVKSVRYRKVGEKFTPEEIDILQHTNQKDLIGCEGLEWTQDLSAPKDRSVWYLVRNGSIELQAILVAGSLNDYILEIRTWDQASVETAAVKQDKLDKLKGL
jgi:hypothetical protein